MSAPTEGLAPDLDGIQLVRFTESATRRPPGPVALEDDLTLGSEVGRQAGPVAARALDCPDSRAGPGPSPLQQLAVAAPAGSHAGAGLGRSQAVQQGGAVGLLVGVDADHHVRFHFRPPQE